MKHSGPVFFFHIPKTAGSTMQGLLSQHFSQKDICAAGTWTTLLELDRSSLGSKMLFQGHFFGPLEKVVEKRCFSFTILRDPIERALSHYGHVIRSPNHYLYHRANELGSLEAYLADPVARMTVSNYQARMVGLNIDVESIYRDLAEEQKKRWALEQYIETTDFGWDEEEILIAAQERLSELGVVGITERFNDTLALLCYQLHWPYPDTFLDRNTNPNRPKREHLSGDTLRMLEEINRVDLMLYDWARHRFETDFQHMLSKLLAQSARWERLDRLTRFWRG